MRCAQLQQQLSESQLRALKMQLHPHFLFNTLNALSTLVKKGENESARKMINRFADFLRLTIEEQGANEIPLEQELAFVDRYLDVEKIRFQEKLNIERKIDPETLSGFVPNLILQPLIENALRYAIAPKEKAGHLLIQTQRDNGRLFIHIEDDGPGLPEDFQLESTEGVGIRNVCERLRSLYGDRARFDLGRSGPGGLSIDIQLPFQPCSDSTI